MSSSSCTRSQTALTSDCNSLCPEGHPCVAYAAEDKCSSSTATFGNCTGDDHCAYECFATGSNVFTANGAIDYSTYTFLIPFDTNVEPRKHTLSWSREQEEAANFDPVTNLITRYASKSNDVLHHIEPLDFKTSITRVALAGGSSVLGVRGEVAEMQLPRRLFTADVQLQAVYVVNRTSKLT